MNIKTPYYFALARYCRKRGHNNTAARYYKKLVESAPTVNRWRSTYVNMLIKVNNYDEAIKHIDILLKSDPNNLDYLLLKARHHTYTGNYDEAQKIYHDLLLKHPDDCRVSYYVANSYFKNDQYNDAIKYYERAINLADELGNDQIASFSHHRLGHIYETMDDPKKSTNHYIQAVDKSKYKQVKNCGVGYLHFRAGWHEQALAEYKKLAKINSNNPELWFEMGRVYTKLSNQAEAAKSYKKFIETDPVYQENPTMDEKLVVFDAFMARNFADSPRAIYEYMRDSSEYKDYKFIWVFRKFDPQAHKHLYVDTRTKIVKYKSAEYFRAYARAKYWVTNSRLPFILKNHDEQVYIQCWHGTPLKRLGHDVVENYTSAKYTNDEMADQYDSETKKLDYFLSPSSYASEKFRSAFALEKFGKSDSIIEEGYPRNDRLINASQDEIDGLKKKLNIPEGKKVLLYAPTWRDNQYAEGQGYTYKTQADFDYLQDKLGDDWIILFRAHYFVANGFDFKKYGGFIRDVSGVDDVNDLYLVSDTLMTDYSSVFFDYANLERPILFFMYDLDMYRDNIRGFYINLEDLPGNIIKTEEEIVSTLADLESYSDEQRSKYVDFNNRFNYLDDGKATERVVKAINI